MNTIDGPRKIRRILTTVGITTVLLALQVSGGLAPAHVSSVRPERAVEVAAAVTGDLVFDKFHTAGRYTPDSVRLSNFRHTRCGAIPQFLELQNRMQWDDVEVMRSTVSLRQDAEDQDRSDRLMRAYLALATDLRALAQLYDSCLATVMDVPTLLRAPTCHDQCPADLGTRHFVKYLELNAISAAVEYAQYAHSIEFYKRYSGIALDTARRFQKDPDYAITPSDDSYRAIFDNMFNRYCHGEGLQGYFGEDDIIAPNC